MSNNLKKLAAEKALEFVQSGMVVGLGSGSTVSYFLECLGDSLKSGFLSGIKGVPTSEDTARKARELGIALTTLAVEKKLDLAVDGADEVDPDLNLIKGLGKALLREKLVEIQAEQFLVIVDESKLVSKLATKGFLPVEIVRFEVNSTLKWLETLGCRVELWLENEQPVITDNGNYLARCWFEKGIDDANLLADRLDKRTGVVEHGLFLKMAQTVIVAGNQGVKVLKRK